MTRTTSGAIALALFLASVVQASVGDPQIGTDHDWYPGELSSSTFARLFEAQAKLYKRVTGKSTDTDEYKALAAWLWRNTHYAHAEEGAEDIWGKGFTTGDLRTREYWTGLYSHGFALCGTTHAQWCAEMHALFGHNRGRVIGAAGHNSFEVFLTGGPYGKGKWVLLDHDLSTVVFNDDGTGLLSLSEVKDDWKKLTSRTYKPTKQHGWLVCGLHPGDGGSFARYSTAEYFAGYSGPPPMVHLRRGEKFRRYLHPGLADGKTFVFWGRNYNTGGVPGIERSHAWVNQPEKMFGSKSGTGYKPGQARYGNAVFTYKPDFAGDYKEGVVEEGPDKVVFEFRSPYLIAATPSNNKPWGVYDKGCKNGLILSGKADCAVAVSTDAGKTWQDCGKFKGGLDLTDRVKGHRQYLLRLGCGAKALKDSGLTITTVCQANPAVMPRLSDGGSTVGFRSTGKVLASAGPTLPHAQKHVVEGKFGSPRVTLELSAPRREKVVAVYAAAHMMSSNPPSPKVKYQIEASTDGGKTWKSIVKDWSITRRGDEPKDFWSQSFCWGSLDLAGAPNGLVRVRFRNDGGKSYARCEAHLVYQPAKQDDTKVTFGWEDDKGGHEASHTFGAKSGPWKVPTGKKTRTKWVEMEPSPGR
jgi:hypothetical protein